MQPHWVNDKKIFIAGWYNNTKLCEELIQYHKVNPDRAPGRINNVVNPEKKDSIDCILEDQSLLYDYSAYLQQAVEKYIDLYPWSNAFASWAIVEPINIQYYQPGAGYHAWHTERSNTDYPSVLRHLVFMTYLNTVGGGETEWLHQDIKIKPEQALTVIWPVDWCFTHRGLPSSEDKYIITGWFSFHR